MHGKIYIEWTQIYWLNNFTSTILFKFNVTEPEKIEMNFSQLGYFLKLFWEIWEKQKGSSL